MGRRVPAGSSPPLAREAICRRSCSKGGSAAAGRWGRASWALPDLEPPAGQAAEDDRHHVVDERQASSPASWPSFANTRGRTGRGSAATAAADEHAGPPRGAPAARDAPAERRADGQQDDEHPARPLGPGRGTRRGRPRRTAARRRRCARTAAARSPTTTRQAIQPRVRSRAQNSTTRASGTAGASVTIISGQLLAREPDDEVEDGVGQGVHVVRHHQVDDDQAGRERRRGTDLRARVDVRAGHGHPLILPAAWRDETHLARSRGFR